MYTLTYDLTLNHAFYNLEVKKNWYLERLKFKAS